MIIACDKQELCTPEIIEIVKQFIGDDTELVYENGLWNGRKIDELAEAIGENTSDVSFRAYHVGDEVRLWRTWPFVITSQTDNPLVVVLDYDLEAWIWEIF